MKSRLTETDFFDLDDTSEDPLNLVPPDLFNLIPGFLDRREKEVGELRDMLQRGNYGGIKDVGHRLKGTGSGYGFELISDIGREMEIAALARERDTITRLINQLDAITRNLKSLLRMRQDTA